MEENVQKWKRNSSNIDKNINNKSINKLSEHNLYKRKTYISKNCLLI